MTVIVQISNSDLCYMRMLQDSCVCVCTPINKSDFCDLVEILYLKEAIFLSSMPICRYSLFSAQLNTLHDHMYAMIGLLCWFICLKSISDREH